MVQALIDTTAGAGDTGKAGGDKINRNFARLDQRSHRFAPVYAMFDGDSKGQEPLQALRWLRAFDGVELREAGTDLNVGGSDTSARRTTDYTHPTRLGILQTTLNAHTAAGRVIDYYLTIGTNGVAALDSPTQMMADVRKVHEQYLRTQPCFRYLFLFSVDPRTGSNGTTSQSVIHTLNRLYERYALANSWDVIFVDTNSVLVDPASALGNPLATTMGDGLHCNAYGNFKKQGALRRAGVASLYRNKPFRSLTQAAAEGTGNTTGGNMIAKGRVVAMGGGGSLTNTGTGTVTGTAPDGASLSGSIDGNVSVAFTATTVDVTTDNNLIPRGSWPCVRISVSGTAVAKNTITIQMTKFGSTIVGGETVNIGGLINLNAATGVAGIYMTSNQTGPLGEPLVGSKEANTGPIQDALSGPMLIETNGYVSTGAAANFNASFNITWPAGAVLGGSIDLLLMYVERVLPIPAATA